MKKIFLSAVSFVIFVLQIQAQVQVNNDLKNLINHSFGYFPKLKEAANSVVTAEDKIALTQTASNPTIGAQAGYLYMAPVSKVAFPGSTETFKFVPNHNYTTSVNANYVLADFGRIKANVERAKVDLQFAKDNIELIKSQLANQVATIYYNMVYLQKAISIQDSVLNFLTENKKIVQSKLNDGEALKIDLLNIQANIDNEENRKVDLKNSLQKQLNLLNYTTGTNAPAGNSFDFGIATVNSQTALDSSVINNLDFKIAKDKINQANGDINIAKLLDKPSITMNGGVGFKNGYIPDIYNVQFNGLAGITLNIPLYSGGRTKQQVKLQEHLVQQQQLALESLNANYKKISLRQ